MIAAGWWRFDVGRVFGVPSHASVAVLSALCGDALSPVLRPGGGAQRHHRRALATELGYGDVKGGHFAGRCAQRREQQRAARSGDIGVPGRGGEDQRAVGELLFAPAAEGFHQMMLSTG